LFTTFLLSVEGAGDTRDATAYPKKNVWANLVGQIWLDLCEIWAKLRQNLGKIEAEFGQN